MLSALAMGSSEKLKNKCDVWQESHLLGVPTVDISRQSKMENNRDEV